MEHVLRHTICSHLNRNNILVNAHHGFRKGRSCETQLILTADDLARVLDKSSQTDMFLLDKVPHQRRLLKLHHYRIHGQTLRWIKSFLADKTQQVVVEGQSSAVCLVTSGVPQGSVLGPTLFVVNINDLNKHTTSSSTGRSSPKLTSASSMNKTWKSLKNGKRTGKCPSMPASATSSPS